MTKERLKELHEKYVKRDLLKELSWAAFNTFIGYILKADGEFINWLCSEAYEEIKRLREKQEPDWTPVSQTPPRKEKTYLVQLDNGKVYQCRWTDCDYFFGTHIGVWKWNITDIPCDTSVAAWRPMPKLWKGEEK